MLIISFCITGCGNNNQPASSYKEIEKLDEAIQNNPPKIAEPYIIRAKFRMQNKDFKGALSDAETALKIAPNNNLALTIKKQAEVRIKQESAKSEK